MKQSRSASGPANEASATPHESRLGLDLVLGAALLVLVGMIVSPLIDAVRQRDRMRAVAAEARGLYDGFRRYYEKNHAYPAPEAERPFQYDILSSLQRAGYYSGEIDAYLVNGRVDAYDAPKDEGQGREYWVEMTLDADSTLRVLVAHSDDAPMGRGKWMDGAFLLRDGKVEPL